MNLQNRIDKIISDLAWKIAKYDQIGQEIEQDQKLLSQLKKKLTVWNIEEARFRQKYIKEPKQWICNKN